jgi:hypothetical protein
MMIRTPWRRLNPGEIPAYAVGQWSFFGYRSLVNCMAIRGRVQGVLAYGGQRSTQASGF